MNTEKELQELKEKAEEVNKELKEKVEGVNKELKELTEKELDQVAGGIINSGSNRMRP